MQKTYQSSAISKLATKQGNCLAGLATEWCLSRGQEPQAREVLKLSFHSMGGDTEKVIFHCTCRRLCYYSKRSLHSVYNILGAMVQMQKF